MRKCQTKAIPTDLGTFSHIPAYLKIIMHFQAYSGITQPRQIYAQELSTEILETTEDNPNKNIVRCN